MVAGTPPWWGARWQTLVILQRVNVRGQHPVGIEMWSSEKVDLSGSKLTSQNFLVSGSKFTKRFFVFGEIIAIDQSVL